MAERKDSESGLGSFAWGTVIGTLAGAVLAFLFAPRSGQELRDDLSDAAGDVRRQITGETVAESLEAAKAEARRMNSGSS
ncbi:MAG: YtxH domain-containing protein [Anaerolineae bacterium]|nr:YtxH domain-containing protein [Anaerolineae bacterium]